jgi:hypothetical protein
MKENVITKRESASAKVHRRSQRNRKQSKSLLKEIFFESEASFPTFTEPCLSIERSAEAFDGYAKMHHQGRNNNTAAEKAGSQKGRGYRSVVFLPRRSQITSSSDLSPSTSLFDIGCL